MSNFFNSIRLYSAMLLCPWDFPGKNTGVGWCFLLQRLFLTQGLNLDLLHCRRILYQLSHQGRLVWWSMAKGWIKQLPVHLIHKNRTRLAVRGQGNTSLWRTKTKLRGNRSRRELTSWWKAGQGSVGHISSSVFLAALILFSGRITFVYRPPGLHIWGDVLYGAVRF